MPIIAEYKVAGYTESNEPVIDSTEEYLCPQCRKGMLKHRAHVHRHIRKEDTGKKEWYWIPLSKCDNKNCGAMRRLLPDFMVPYKHYEEEAVSDVLNEVITEESPVDFPSVQTMRHWKAWLFLNKDRIESLFRGIGYTILGFGEELIFDQNCLLDQLRRKTDNWLKIMIRFVYNSGHRLLSLQAACLM